jgi:prophage antirepressor-like protein
VFYDAFMKLCEMHGKTASEALRGSGLSKYAYHRWKNGTPMLETKIKLADYFGMTVKELDAYAKEETATAEVETNEETVQDKQGGNEVEVFTHKDFGEIRTIQIDGEPWFVANDVMRVLEVSNSKDAIRTLDDDEKSGVDIIDPHGRKQKTNCISEAGLYSIILRSRKPEAKAFKRWVTHEVIPSIRKHGAYLTPQKIEDALLNPDVIINLALQLKTEKQKNAELTAKAAYYDAVAGASGSTNFRDTAKMLGISEKKFIETVLGKKYCYRAADKKIVPYSQYMVAGWFEVREVYYGSPEDPHCTIQTRITPYGRQNIYIRFKREGIL